MIGLEQRKENRRVLRAALMTAVWMQLGQGRLPLFYILDVLLRAGLKVQYYDNHAIASEVLNEMQTRGQIFIDHDRMVTRNENWRMDE